MAENDDDLGISTATTAEQIAAKATGKPIEADPAPDPVETDEWTPPTKSEWEKTQKDLATANRESKERREKLTELTRASEDADGKAERERAEAAEAKYKPIAVKAAARAAFLEAGLSGASTEKVTKLFRLIDVDSVVITDSGDVEGLDAQIETLRSDFPEMFGGVSTPRPRAARLDTGDRRPAAGAPKTSAEKIAAQVMGGGG